MLLSLLMFVHLAACIFSVDLFLLSYGTSSLEKPNIVELVGKCKGNLEGGSSYREGRDLKTSCVEFVIWCIVLCATVTNK